MEFAKNMMVILLTAILAENFILTKFLGICPFFGRFEKAGFRYWHERSGYFRYGDRYGGYFSDLCVSVSSL